jgi:hypothetical protein
MNISLKTGVLWTEKACLITIFIINIYSQDSNSMCLESVTGIGILKYLIIILFDQFTNPNQEQY